MNKILLIPATPRRFFHGRGFLSAVFGLSVVLLAGCGGSSSAVFNPPANLQGNWGGGTPENPAALMLTASGGQLSFACGAFDALTQPLAAGSNGTFDVVATQHIPLLIPVGGATQVHLVGTVSGRTLTLHEVYATGSGATYTLTYAQTAPTFNGACPG